MSVLRWVVFSSFIMLLVACAQENPRALQSARMLAEDAPIQVGEQLLFVLPSQGVFYRNSPNMQNFALLAGVAEYLQAIKKITVSVEVFTDNIETPRRNLALSQQRAQQVADYLWWYGIDARVITAEGYGADFPIANNANAAGRKQNQRIEIRTRVLGRKRHAKTVA